MKHNRKLRLELPVPLKNDVGQKQKSKLPRTEGLPRLLGE